MARRTAPASTKKAKIAEKLRAAAAKDEQLLNEICRGLDDEKKTGRVPLTAVDSLKQ